MKDFFVRIGLIELLPMLKFSGDWESSVDKTYESCFCCNAFPLSYDLA